MYYISKTRKGRGDWFSTKTGAPLNDYDNEREVLGNEPMQLSCNNLKFVENKSYKFGRSYIDTLFADISGQKIMRENSDNSIELVTIIDNDTWTSVVFTLIPRKEAI